MNWMGLLGAAVLLGYGVLREPLAAALGGIMLATDGVITVIQWRKKREKYTDFPRSV